MMYVEKARCPVRDGKCKSCRRKYYVGLYRALPVRLGLLCPCCYARLLAGYATLDVSVVILEAIVAAEFTDEEKRRCGV